MFTPKRKNMAEESTNPSNVKTEESAPAEAKPVEEKKPRQRRTRRKKSDDKLKYALGLAVILLLAIVIVLVYVLTQKTTPILPVNNTNNNTGTNLTNTVQVGSDVFVYYIIAYENGTILTQGNYTTSEATVGPVSILGLKEGDEETKTMKAEEFYGSEAVYSTANIINMSRITILPNQFELPNESFEMIFAEPAELDKSYQNKTVIMWLPIDAKVTDIQNDTIYLVHNNQNNVLIDATFGILGLKGKLDVNDTNLTISLAGNNMGDVVLDYYGRSGKIINITDDEVFVDFNSPLVGKNLKIYVKILNIKTFQKLSVPKVELFVMSYCPYGLQMERAIIPVKELLGDKANITIRFVSYILHGDKEQQENNRQICIRELYPAKFWTYLRCFVETGNYTSCLGTVGISQSGLESCMNNINVYEAEDTQGNTDYGVSGSPTLVINGKTFSVTRSPEQVKQAICSAFATPPNECNTILTTTEASAGFGAIGSTGSTGDASCG